MDGPFPRLKRVVYNEMRAIPQPYALRGLHVISQKTQCFGHASIDRRKLIWPDSPKQFQSAEYSELLQPPCPIVNQIVQAFDEIALAVYQPSEGFFYS